jgi:hypothetical protein
MKGRDSHIGFLRTLTPEDRDREVKQELTDSLQELVAQLERQLPLDGNTLRSCVIDDFQVQETELRDRECRVRLRFSASAKPDARSSGELSRMGGQAEAIIDDSDRVAYRVISCTRERSFVPPDIGGGD